MDREMEIARAVAPEDIRPGEYVSVLHVVCECMPPPWERADWNGRLSRVLLLPSGNPSPVQVVDVCIPYVLVKTARGKRRMIDVRKYRLARVSEEFGRRVFEEIEAEKQAEKHAADTETKEPNDDKTA